MKSNILILILVLLSFVACDPAGQGSLIKEAEQSAHNDSLKRMAEEKLKLEQETANQDSVSRIEAEIISVTQSIGLAKAEYEVQLDKLTKIKKFRLFRPKEDREAQIREQSDALYKLEVKKSELEYRLVNLQVRLDFFRSELRKEPLN